MSAIYHWLPRVLDARQALNIIELGAHHGQDTAALRMMFPRARIWAFEPDPRNAHKLRRAPVASRGAAGGVFVVEAAVSDTDGTATFRLSSGSRPRGPEDPSPRGGSAEPWTYSSSLKEPVEHLRVVPWVKFGETAKVKTVRLDTFCAEQQPPLRHVDFIWADVQGAEDLFIAGAQDTLTRVRLLYTEFAEIEMYRGQLGLKGILERLPGRWEVVAKFDHDVLLKNLDAYSGMYL
ncbi:MAG: FkbM family methyltransferase [Phycisphaerales bacterium]